jgi:chromosome partitioning protein
MLSIQGSAELCRIVVLNPKGGSGKTTLASALAGYFASRGRKVAIIDMDKQGSSTHWLATRPAEFRVIHGVFSTPDSPGIPADYHVNLPPEIELAIVDTPAGIPSEDLSKYTVGSHAIIVPVMPSEFDIHAASRLIADRLLVVRVSRENRRLGVVANRVKERTIAFKQLMKFLKRLSIPVIGIIRDSQNYVGAAREGI